MICRQHKRDGYAENLYTGNKIDGRDQYAARGAIRLTPGEAFDATLTVNYYKEDSNRARTLKQLCHRDPTGAYGCLPDRLAFETVNGTGTLGGLWAAILPLVITYSALAHRHDPGGWWNYTEGFRMWDITIDTLAILLVAFVLGFITLHLLNRRKERRDHDEQTFDEERLALRLGLADELYTSKYGDQESRLQQRTVRIEPYSDFETFELRDLYRTHGVD